jgi:hypothetical protein
MEKFDIKDIVAIGRTFDEYRAFFGLDGVDLRAQSILDAGGGVSSFVAEAGEKGIAVVSADRLYKFSHEELGQKLQEDVELTVRTLLGCSENYLWTYYRDADDLRLFRETAYKKFLADYKGNRGKKYVTAEFPYSCFMDREFTLTLVSHFLFLYDEHLDYEFHRNTLEELVRITKGEIRIFPIVNLRWKRSGFVDMFLKDPVFSRYDRQIVKVDFEFVRGGNEMLIIRT